MTHVSFTGDLLLETPRLPHSRFLIVIIYFIIFPTNRMCETRINSGLKQEDDVERASEISFPPLSGQSQSQ